MSLQTIPYQPLPFDIEENCTLPCANWIQKIERGDRTSVQFLFGACGDAGNMINNGQFEDGSTNWTASTGGGGWTFTDNEATSPVSQQGVLVQTMPTQDLDYMEVTFTAVVNNGELIFSTDYPSSFVISSSGTYTYVIPCAGATTFIKFNFNTALGGVISNVIVKPINTRSEFKVVDLDGNVIDSIPDSWINYSDGFLTISANTWDTLSLPDGCYQIVAYDACECSQFGFAGDDFLLQNQFIEYSGDLSIDTTNGRMYSLVTGGGLTQARSTATFCRETEYSVSYTVTGLDGANGDDFVLKLGSVSGVTRTTDGTYSETITTAATTAILQARFLFTHGVAGSTSIYLSNFSIEAVDKTISYTSEKFQLKDDHNCTVLIEACGVGNEFSFGFIDTGFKPIIRLDGTYRYSNHPTTKEEYEYSNGYKAVPYMRTRGAWTFLFGAPSYVFQFASLWLGFTNLYIQGNEMASEDGEYPSVSWEEDVDLGTATFTFSKRTDLTEKRSCSSFPNVGCVDDGYAVVVGTGGGKVDGAVGAVGELSIFGASLLFS